MQIKRILHMPKLFLYSSGDFSSKSVRVAIIVWSYKWCVCWLLCQL